MTAEVRLDWRSIRAVRHVHVGFRPRALVADLDKVAERIKNTCVIGVDREVDPISGGDAMISQILCLTGLAPIRRSIVAEEELLIQQRASVEIGQLGRAARIIGQQVLDGEREAVEANDIVFGRAGRSSRLTCRRSSHVSISFVNKASKSGMEVEANLHSQSDSLRNVVFSARRFAILAGSAS